MFSKRTGTPAFDMPNQVEQKIKQKRVNEILKIVKEIKGEK